MIRFLPWRFLVKRAARRYGVLDPAGILARLRSFAQPSEVAEPMELLRAGIVFHARGLVNSKAIQQNLDWVWPYWVEQQFDPQSTSFIPRAFSFSHVNLSHRNWAATGLPGVPLYPLVDPRGLLTPLHDGWSLDFWIIGEGGKRLLPSKLPDRQIVQRTYFGDELEIETVSERDGMRLGVASRMVVDEKGEPVVLTDVSACSDAGGWLAVAVRPYNPEGVQFVNSIRSAENGMAMLVNDEDIVRFSEKPAATRMSHYADGDVYLDIAEAESCESMECPVGMATAAVLFRLVPEQRKLVGLRTSLDRDIRSAKNPIRPEATWESALAGTARLTIAGKRMEFLYESAVRTLLMLSADELVPGPYTYRRFWFRDACLMLFPLIAIGQVTKARRIIGNFASRQTHAGYFLSQEGEWDSNGQVLWIAARFSRMTGERLDDEVFQSLLKGVRWLSKKRLPEGTGEGTAGLLPAGFSAEHLGPNDFYYWDDFWAWAGLREISDLWKSEGRNAEAEEAASLAGEFEASIENSIGLIPKSRSKGGIPAAPGRRMDAGAIGSMVADYPLRLYPPGDPRVMATAEFLMDRCMVKGGFFQEMIHSGINAYLTLDLAQTFLRAGDPRYADLMRSVASLATPTGQWPEAIHPQTLGGCMGDGQHGWAAAEWIMMIRNCFVREEGEVLVIGSGILPEWLEGEPAEFGPTLTPWGAVRVRCEDDVLEVCGDWRDAAPELRVEVPGRRARVIEGSSMKFKLSPG